MRSAHERAEYALGLLAAAELVIDRRMAEAERIQDHGYLLDARQAQIDNVVRIMCADMIDDRLESIRNAMPGE